MVKNSQLQGSLKLLNRITNESYNPGIRKVVLELWSKHLKPENPQWEFIIAQPFSIKGEGGSAHVMAMIDERLPGIGIVGYFACTNAEVGTKVLEDACSWLKSKHGVKEVYGPINGTLPVDYRLNLSDDFRFPGEPVNPTWHTDAFRRAGFEIFNRYESAISKLIMIKLRFSLIKPSRAYRHVSVRQFNNDNFDAEFKVYHDLRNAIFPLQSIYCPAISLAERLYNSSGKFDPQYTYFLMDGERSIGFVMAYKFDGRLIFKSIGMLPEYQGKHLSSLLIKPIYTHAVEDEIREVIFAMVRVGNAAHKTKGPGTNTFRRYVTMHKGL